MSRVDWMEFELSVRQLAYGKRLPGAVYVHREAEACKREPFGPLLQSLATRHSLGEQFNIVKFRTDAPRLSFLSYPDFFDERSPSISLLESATTPTTAIT
jgi:hypothetical protein